MKKSLFLTLCSIVILSSSFGAKVDIQKAQHVGSNFYYQRFTQHHEMKYQELGIVDSFSEKFNGRTVYYIFNFRNGGYVIVSADDAVPPVLGYSFEGKFSQENQPPQFINWMQGYAKQIDQSIMHHENSFDFHETWQQLSSDAISNLDFSPLTDVAPLLVSTWDQGTFYNLLCPEDPAGPNGHVWAGCVATAMSQVMYYYRWPVTGVGSHCYVPNGYAQQCADFGNTTYKWDEMVNACGFRDTAVATLIWHAGISVNMMYSPGGSGAYSEDALNSMINTFRYSPNAHLVARDGMPTDQYTAILRDNLDHKRVMYYDGYGTGGHAFNMDGYQGTDYFHFNWGWSGSFNGYFYLNNLNPGGDDFTNGQRAMVELYPDTINNFYPSYCTGQHVLTALTGTFEDGSGPIENYSNNDNCSWLINPQSLSDSIVRITINFNRFSTESGNDIVTIYNGGSTSDSVVATFSGDNIPSAVIVNASKALVTFTTNGNNTKPGWYINYNSKSYDWCSGLKTFTDPTGTITDGSSGYNYRNSSVCRWEITPSSGDPLRLVFNSFKTEAVNDNVKVYDLQTQQLLAEYSGEYTTSSPPPSVVSPSGKMFILFSTNLITTDEGWSASWTTYPLGTNDKIAMEYQVFPNPASNEIFIRFYSSTASIMSSEFLDMDGKVLISENLPATIGWNKKSVDVSGLQSGVYLLRLISTDGIIIRKIVIQ